ncbi:EpsG family protein [Fusobacterium sp. MFO224]|uniref:EpsG family protein n=1 Tax=Fusobacterium sp. MFO224 TaxID=3378070 RepID=UPI00385215BE
MNNLGKTIENLISSGPILIAFILSIIIAKFYQKFRLKQNYYGEIYVRKISNYKKFIWNFFIVIFPSIFLGIRGYNVGYDTHNNWINYLNVSNISLIKDFKEVGTSSPLFWIFRVLSYKIIGNNVSLYLILLSFLTLIIMTYSLEYWIKEISLPMSLFLYYSFFGLQLMNQSRQMLALSILLYALKFKIENKNKYYFLIIFLGMMIHYSAIIGIGFYFLDFRKKNYKLKKKVYFVFFIAIIFLLPKLSFLLSKLMIVKYRYYFLNYSFNKFGFGFYLNVLPVIFPVVLLRKYDKTKKGDYLKRILYLIIILRLMGYCSYFIMRMYYYSAIVLIILIPMLLNKVKNRGNRKIIKVIIILIYASYYIVNYGYANSAQILPYYTIFK